jgi:hypothetical protein
VRDVAPYDESQCVFASYSPPQNAEQEAGECADRDAQPQEPPVITVVEEAKPESAPAVVAAPVAEVAVPTHAPPPFPSRMHIEIGLGLHAAERAHAARSVVETVPVIEPLPALPPASDVAMLAAVLLPSQPTDVPTQVEHVVKETPVESPPDKKAEPEPRAVKPKLTKFKIDTLQMYEDARLDPTAENTDRLFRRLITYSSAQLLSKHEHFAPETIRTLLSKWLSTQHST